MGSVAVGAQKNETHVSSAGYDTESFASRLAKEMGNAGQVPSPGYRSAARSGGGVRGRTYRRLLAQAMKLAEDGRLVTVAEVAAAAGVSRATAYRYFPAAAS